MSGDFVGIDSVAMAECVGELDEVRRKLASSRTNATTIANRVSAGVEVERARTTYKELVTLIDDINDLLEVTDEQVCMLLAEGYGDQAILQAMIDRLSAMYAEHLGLGEGATGLTTDELRELADTQDEGERLKNLRLPWWAYDLDLTTPEGIEHAEQSLRAMNDAELAAWIEHYEQEDTFTDVTSVIDLDVVQRIAEISNRLNPPLRGMSGDSARGGDAVLDAKFFDYQYRDMNGQWQLYPPGASAPDPAHFKQGRIGDCYLIAGMVELGYEDPTLLSDLMERNPNGTYTVTFADGHREVVTPDVVFTSSDHNAKPGLARSVTTDSSGADTDTLFAPLLEKAYAQRHGGYGEISTGGFQSAAIENLTGRPRDDTTSVSFDDIAEMERKGYNLGLSSLDPPQDASDAEVKAWKNDPNTPELYNTTQPAGKTRLAPGHAYVIVDVDETAQTVTLVNPWEAKTQFTVTKDELERHFDATRINVVE